MRTLSAALVVMLFLSWVMLTTPDPDSRCWEVDVMSSSFHGPPIETWHVVGRIESDSEGFVFVCREHGRIRVERFMVVGIRPAVRDTVE